MSYITPDPVNEPIGAYAQGSSAQKEVQSMLSTMRQARADIGMYIDGQEIKSEQRVALHPPHDHRHILGHYHLGSKSHIEKSISSCLSSHHSWSALPMADRAGVFLRAAALLSGPYRTKMNAATMLGQSKNIHQSEIDAVCELADFFRFNARYAEEITQHQPISSSGEWNRLHYRALEGFVLAITPFNFTSIAANLACAPALMGNTVLWKPSDAQIYSCRVIIEILEEAGLPKGVINVVYAAPEVLCPLVLSHREFAGLHFTGSTQVFQQLWQTIATHLPRYKNYPRIVGETGGKDFILAHASASEAALKTAFIRGAFEYQGQKCSAASRAYIPKGMWQRIKGELQQELATITMGGVEDMRNFINAVITRASFEKIKGFIDRAKGRSATNLCYGGQCDDTKGYFITPTVFETQDPRDELMREEIFGPVLCVYPYDESRYEEILSLVDDTSVYGLTGAIFAQDISIIRRSMSCLRYAAGNLYINDKPTGAVVGQQPFGGARASGTNDKAGSMLNLLRWCSPQTIKETFSPPTQYPYPFMA